MTVCDSINPINTPPKSPTFITECFFKANPFAYSFSNIATGCCIVHFLFVSIYLGVLESI